MHEGCRRGGCNVCLLRKDIDRIAGKKRELAAEIERLRALLRDECIGHDDRCRCKACVAVFAAEGRGEGEK